MVKNNNGGKNSKKMGRKFVTAPINKSVRVVLEEGEIYASVTKMLGNGMFNATCTEGRDRLVIMRNKFRGKGKRDNTVKVGSWVLIGEREFESCAKPKHDLLEVYTDTEVLKLKNSKDPIFAKLITDPDLHSKSDISSDITFEKNMNNEKNSDLIDLAEVDEENPYLNKDISRSIIIEDGTVDVDDI
jgi:initiation factor 1A|tara:strand:- start:29 stop:589 length:561 start_codon:yes stop_codon:yes gene_type:complete